MPSKKAYIEIVKYRRHFRIYFKNNHPAYIVGEEGDLYIFHRVTHSKSSGGRENWEIIPNPLTNSDRPMRIVKKQEHDNKKRFSPFELETREGVDVSFPKIKIKTGSAQAVDSRTNVSSSKNIKTNKPGKDKNKKKTDISYPEIKRAGQTSQSTGAAQTKHDYLIGRAWIPSGKSIKAKRKKKS